MTEILPDERPQRRREYSGPGSTLGLAALLGTSACGRPASAQPRNTATTGLTNAYVDTRAGVLTLSSHT
jgi:hypothetical protein